MKKIVTALAVLTCIVAAQPARAEMGTVDAVPAATLLLPYFEVDLAHQNGITTVFSVNNASASAAVVNVTVWTDWGVPSLGFQIYLTGYDVQTVDMRDIFNGILPVTADAGADPTDTNAQGDGTSNRGTISQDINFPGSVGPCGSSGTVYGQPDPSLAIKIQNLQRVHQGLNSPLNGQCWGATFGDQIARGYVTMDSVTSCGLQTPADVGYAVSVLDTRNILWGDYLLIDRAQNQAQGETLVHIEACASGAPPYSGYVGNGAGLCPLTAGDYSFYARYQGGQPTDQREPLATTFAARYTNAKKSDLLVWRDTKTGAAGGNGPRPCGVTPNWFPLSQTDVVGFDEQENPTDLCFVTDNVSPAVGGSQACFPLATQRVNVKKGNGIAKRMKVAANAGWIFLNLNHTIAGDPFPGVAQAWVSSVSHKGGRFNSGNAVALDNALTASPGGVQLLP